MKLDIFQYDENTKNLVNDFLFAKNIEKYILGTNLTALNLSNIIHINAFINDFTENKTFNNRSLIHSDFAKKDSIVVSASLSIYAYSAVRSLQEKGFKKIITIPDILNYSSLAINTFLSDAKKDIELNYDQYTSIYQQLNDELSRNAFKNLLNFRKNGALTYLSSFSVDPIGQYFEDFLNFTDNEVFVDAGGYDGQTSIEFIKHCPRYKSIYILEPSKENLALAEKNLKNFKNVNFISKGLSNQKDILRFDTGSGSASSISDNGTIEIEVDTLDELVNEKVTFIKMDIEGAEALAIEGMKRHIFNDYPKMAISVYHKVDDLWKIPEQILAIRDDYDLYLRHYTEGTDETVMFFIPKFVD